MTKISFKIQQIGKDSTILRSLKKYLTPDNYQLLQQGDTLESENWVSPKGFFVRLSVDRQPILIYGATQKERVVYGFGSPQAFVGVHGFGEGVVLPVLSKELASSEFYFGHELAGSLGPGDDCKLQPCRQLYVKAQDGYSFRMTQPSPERIAFDFFDTHGEYRRSSKGSGSWIYSEKDLKRPSETTRIEVIGETQTNASNLPDWQKMLPPSARMMMTDGAQGFVFASANGTEADTRFERQQQFWGLHDAMVRESTERNLVVGLSLALLIAGSILVGINLRKRQSRRATTSLR